MCIHEVLQLCTVRVQVCDSHHEFGQARQGYGSGLGWVWEFGSLAEYPEFWETVNPKAIISPIAPFRNYTLGHSSSQ